MENWERERDERIRERNADIRAQNIVDAIDEADDNAEERHRRLIEEQRRQFEFQIWWDSLTFQEKREWQEEQERIRLEKIRRHNELMAQAQREAAERAREAARAEAARQALRAKLAKLNSKAAFLGLRVGRSQTQQSTPVEADFDRVRRIRKVEVFAVLGVAAISWVLVGLNRALYLTATGARSPFLDSFMTFLALVTPFGLAFLLHVRLSNFFARREGLKRQKRNPGGYQAALPELAALKEKFESLPPNRLRTGVLSGLAAFLMVFPWSTSLIEGPIANAIAKAEQVQQIAEREAASRENGIISFGQSWLELGRDRFYETSEVTDRDSERAQLFKDLAELKDSLQARDFTNVSRMTESVRADVLAVGTFVDALERQAVKEVLVPEDKSKLTVLSTSYNKDLQYLDVKIVNNTSSTEYVGLDAYVILPDGSEHAQAPGVICLSSSVDGCDLNLPPNGTAVVRLYFGSVIPYPDTRGATIYLYSNVDGVRVSKLFFKVE